MLDIVKVLVLRRKILLLFLLCAVMAACTTGGEQQRVLERFAESQSLSKNRSWMVEKDSIGGVEGVAVYDNNLVLYDMQSGFFYALFDVMSGQFVGRFGKIGQGPEELPRGCYGTLFEDRFTAFNNEIKSVIEFHMDSLRAGKMNGSPLRLTKYDIPEAEFSRLIPVGKEAFLGAGTYQSRYQFVLFDKDNRILDSGVEVYNADDAAFEYYTKYLANQGCLVRQPGGTHFAYSLNFSSNIDFIDVSDGSINQVQSLRLGNPVYQPRSDGRIFSADITQNTLFGYVDLSGSKRYVYALYSEKNVYGNMRTAKNVLVYDWTGKAVKKYVLDEDAFYIAVSQDDKRLYAVILDEAGDCSVVSYDL